jgi:hypothetical protein
LPSSDPRSQAAIELADKVAPILFKDQRSGVSGAALAQLLAVWLVAHPEEGRTELLLMHMTSVMRMVPVVEATLEEGRNGQGKSQA